MISKATWIVAYKALMGEWYDVQKELRRANAALSELLQSKSEWEDEVALFTNKVAALQKASEEMIGAAQDQGIDLHAELKKEDAE